MMKNSNRNTTIGQGRRPFRIMGGAEYVGKKHLH